MGETNDLQSSINTIILIVFTLLFMWAIISSVWSKIIKADPSDKKLKKTISIKAAITLGILIIIALVVGWLYAMTTGHKSLNELSDQCEAKGSDYKLVRYGSPEYDDDIRLVCEKQP